jgi:TM2 domain-containing membrane protein YozV
MSKFCVGCGAELVETAEVCMKCGTRAKAARVFTTEAGEKSRMVAILLGLFLGGLGFHKFYLGQAMQGVIYLLFFWTGIPLILSIIDIIGYACMSDEQFAAKYH